jgi:preprotein translocase subunit YajC
MNGAAQAPTPAKTARPQASPLAGLFPFFAVLVIFYWLLFRPQQKQAKEREKMLAGLKKGDRILTSGGLYGTITGMKGNDLEVRFAENVKLTLARSAVSAALPPAVSGPSEGAGKDAAPSS